MNGPPGLIKGDVCEYLATHMVAGVPATRVIYCGRALGWARACETCAQRYGMPVYQRGGRVELVRTRDPDTRLRPGDQGTVTGWDPRQGEVFIDWDGGAALIVRPDDGDEVRLISRPAEHGQPGH